MSRNSKLISNNLREEIARELGVYEQVKQDGGSWANVSSGKIGDVSFWTKCPKRNVPKLPKLPNYPN